MASTRRRSVEAPDGDPPMLRKTLQVRRLPQRLRRDASRTILRFFYPGRPERAIRIVDRVMGLDATTVSDLLESCLRNFGRRHADLTGVFEDHFKEAMERLQVRQRPSRDQMLLIGAYFTMEYAYASAALFNPSIVPAMDQSGVSEGAVRFLMSLRAVGEGHVSSIIFRRGTIDADCTITFDPQPRRSCHLRMVEDRQFTRRLFLHKLVEAGSYTDAAGAILAQLGETFQVSDLNEAIMKVREEFSNAGSIDAVADTMLWLAHTNYQVRVPDGADLSQVVIFPISENEAHGLEDMRLVRLVEDDGMVRYLGTYTAYNGSRVLPQIMELHPDRTAEVHTLAGRHATDKGLALFPRRLDGWYAMISRIDGENLYLMLSDNLRFWNTATVLRQPRFHWEFVQIGNCGSPIETERGWLLLTHGVGPMRRYCIGAILLDLDDPSRVVGQLPEPLLAPEPDRGGYVPNVVYSCGSMVHNGSLVIPYGISDVETGFATVSLDELLDAMEP
jgi:predicted GH43/DUF377 family glycosyl hydrolase